MNKDSSPFDLPPGMTPADIARIMRIDGGIVIRVGANNVSFETEEDKTPKDDLPPMEFLSSKYNVKLKVSHSQYKEKYEPFQQELKKMASALGTDILDDVKTEKPAAIRIESDQMTAMRLGMEGNPLLMFMAIASKGDVKLVEAVNFVSDTDNLLMPQCQLLKAVSGKNLFNAANDELLTGDAYRAFEESYKNDLQNQTPVERRRLKVRSVPSQP